MRNTHYTRCGPARSRPRIAASHAQPASVLMRQCHKRSAAKQQFVPSTGEEHSLVVPHLVAWRSPWTRDRAEVIVRHLREYYGIHLNRAVARELVVEYLFLVACHFRSDRHSARQFVTNEVLYASSFEIAAIFRQTQQFRSSAPRQAGD